MSNGTLWMPILGNQINLKPKVKGNTYLPNQTVQLGELRSQEVILIRILITIDTGFKHSDENDLLLIIDGTTFFISVINTRIIPPVEFRIRYSNVEPYTSSKL